MNHFEFFCQYCGQRLQASMSDVGQLADCPSCAMRLTIPPAPSSYSQPALEPMPDDTMLAPDQPFEFYCPACFQMLQAMAGDAGLDVACPACDHMFAIPNPSAPAAAADSSASGMHDEMPEMPEQMMAANRHRPMPPAPQPPIAPEDETAVAFDHFAAIGGRGFDFPPSAIAAEDETADPMPPMPREGNAAHHHTPANLFSFNESARTLDELMNDLPDLRTKSVLQFRSTTVTQSSVPVTPTISDTFGGEIVEEELTDQQADAIKLRAVRTVLDAMTGTADCFAFIEPPAELNLPSAPKPQFLSFVRTELGNPRSAWIFVFFATHILAYHIGDRKSVVCRSPNFQLDVVFRPPKNRQGKAHLGFRLASGDVVHCLIQFAMDSRGPLAYTARDFAVRVRGWIKAHPVLGSQLEERVRSRTEERERQRQQAEDAALKALERYVDDDDADAADDESGAGDESDTPDDSRLHMRNARSRSRLGQRRPTRTTKGGGTTRTKSAPPRLQPPASSRTQTPPPIAPTPPPVQPGAAGAGPSGGSTAGGNSPSPALPRSSRLPKVRSRRQQPPPRGKGGKDRRR